MKSTTIPIVAFAATAAAVVLITGGCSSPFYCLLFFPVLFSAQCGRVRLATGISVVFAALIVCSGLLDKGHHAFTPGALVGMAAALPASAAFSALLQHHYEHRYVALNTTNTELTSRLDMAQMLNSAFDVDMTLNLVLLHAQTISGADYVAVYLRGENENMLDVRASSSPGNNEPFVRSISLSDARLDDWSVSETGYIGERVYGLNIANRDEHLHKSSSAMLDICPDARSFVCLPLSSGIIFLGFLFVGYPAIDGANEETVVRLEDFASRAIFPLHRVLLQHDIQALAFVDSKTGLDNFRQFDANLTDEVVRADRYGHRFSLIVLDIDHFKNFNDTYGHPAGDALLSQLSIVLRNSLRGVDKPARYGGEEFTVICPETGKDEARIIAERIRQNIQDTPFSLPGPQEGSSETTVPLTVSVGFATYPIDARTSSDLLKAADAALYHAKSAGRNNVKCKSDAVAEIPPTRP